MIGLLSDFRVRLGGCVLALALVGGLGVVTQAKDPAAGTEDIGAPDPHGGEPDRAVLSGARRRWQGADRRERGLARAARRHSDRRGQGDAAVDRAAADHFGPGRLGAGPRPDRVDARRLPSWRRWLVQGTGPLAAGDGRPPVLRSRPTGVNRGMASVPCQVPGSDFWFVGASSAAAGRRGRAGADESGQHQRRGRTSRCTPRAGCRTYRMPAVSSYRPGGPPRSTWARWRRSMRDLALHVRLQRWPGGAGGPRQRHER